MAARRCGRECALTLGIDRPHARWRSSPGADVRLLRAMWSCGRRIPTAGSRTSRNDSAGPQWPWDIDPGNLQRRWAPYAQDHGREQGQLPLESIRPREYCPHAPRSSAPSNLGGATPETPAPGEKSASHRRPRRISGRPASRRCRISPRRNGWESKFPLLSSDRNRRDWEQSPNMLQTPEIHPCRNRPIGPVSGITLVQPRRGWCSSAAAGRSGPSTPSAQGYEWQMPQGGIDSGEMPRAAALARTAGGDRRLLGVLPRRSTAMAHLRPARPTCRVAAGRADTGGRSRNGSPSASRATSDEINIDRCRSMASNPSLMPGAGRRIERLPALIIPFKRQVYESVVESFGPLRRAIELASRRCLAAAIGRLDVSSSADG